MLGIWSRSSSRRRQGHSCRKRRATSKVAPPHTSSEAAFLMMCAVAGAAFSMSCVRMRVANRLWCASRLHSNLVLTNHLPCLTSGLSAFRQHRYSNCQNTATSKAANSHNPTKCQPKPAQFFCVAPALVDGRLHEVGLCYGSLHGGVSDEDALVLPDGLCPLVRAFLQQQLPPA